MAKPRLWYLLLPVLGHSSFAGPVIGNSQVPACLEADHLQRSNQSQHDLFDEGLVSLTEAAKLLPPRKGKPVHFATVFRWAQRGLNGVRLETIQAGGTKCTSRPAISRFFQRLSGGTPTTRTPATRTKAIERAENELSQAGV